VGPVSGPGVNQALQQTAGHDSFLGFVAHRRPAAAELGRSAAEGGMTEEALNRIAGGLGITVPAAYWELMLARGEEFRASQLGSYLWARANEVIIENLQEQDPRCSLYDPTRSGGRSTC